jgi:glycyl-tRNA synthetase
MAEPKTNELMEKIVSLCKRRGFIFQSSEIYGGINGFWDYGPLGAELKRNVKDAWWRTMVHQRDDVAGLEATIIMHPQIWKASGHVDTFADLMVEDPITNKRFRADQVEPQSGIVYHFAGAIEADAQSAGDLTGEEFIKIADQVNVPQIWPLQNYPPEEAKSNQERELARMEKAAGAQATKLIFERGQLLPFSILLPLKKASIEKARQAAYSFYHAKHRILNPRLIGGTREEVADTTDYSTDSGARLSYPRPFNLMFKTNVGPVESADSVAYLRPETAQAIFAQFKNVLETSRQKVPFGIAQTGKAFRNEVTPRNFTFRSREFEQMELEFFIKPDEAIEALCGRVARVTELDFSKPGIEPQPDWGWEVWHKYWVEQRIKFYEGIGLPRTTLEEYWQKPEELAHYARACVDILFKFPFGTQELEGIAARSDFDLSQHQRFSGKAMTVFDEELKNAWAKLDKAKQDDLWRRYFENRRKYLTKMAKPEEKPEQIDNQARADADGLAKGWYVPHVIEPSAGVDRLILALIANAYAEEQTTDEKGKAETRVVMRFHPRIAPVKVGVFPLLKNKPELVKKAREVRDLLRPHLTVFYDEAGAIGRRYRRQDEAGTPFGVTIDFDTLGEKPELLDTVTLRERDSMQQTRVKISELLPLLLGKIR